MIFPLEKLKTLRIFTQIWSFWEAEPPNPPLTKGKIFFAFLDVSDHLEAKKKKKKNCGKSPDFSPPARQVVENLFFFLLTIFLDVLAHSKHIRKKKYFSP